MLALVSVRVIARPISSVRVHACTLASTVVLSFLHFQPRRSYGTLDVRTQSPHDRSAFPRTHTQLLEAMVYIHKQDIAHRDIKLENMAVGRDGSIKLIDFGYASHTGRYGWGHSRRCCPRLSAYTQSPEQTCSGILSSCFLSVLKR